jgi:hypothetical protein
LRNGQANFTRSDRAARSGFGRFGGLPSSLLGEGSSSSLGSRCFRVSFWDDVEVLAFPCLPGPGEEDEEPAHLDTLLSEHELNVSQNTCIMWSSTIRFSGLKSRLANVWDDVVMLSLSCAVHSVTSSSYGSLSSSQLRFE